MPTRTTEQGTEMKWKHYAELFRPMRIGRCTMKNRIVMSSLTRCRADDDHVPTAMMTKYYSDRASMGMIITESIMVQRGYSAMAYEPGIYSAAQVEAWRRVTDAVHARGGLIAAQIYHGGRATVAANLAGAGLVPVGASALPIPADAETCIAAWCRDGVAQPFAQEIHAMSCAEIQQMVETFARAARNCIAAGFDCVEIHAGAGFLIDQFLRDGSNRRVDNYGGSVVNRARFLLEVVDAVASAVQPDRVGVRLTPLDSFNGQSDRNPELLLRYVCDELDRRRVAFIDLFRGDWKSATVARSDLWARECFGGAILASHGYADAAAAERAIAEGAVDAVCFGLPAVANPDLVWRILSDTPLNRADLATLFTRGEEGYIDYPIRGPEGFLQPNVVETASMSVCSAERTGRLSRRGTVVAPAKDRPFYAISQPLLIGNIFMKNRLVMGPIARQRCDANHCPMPMMVDYYARRAGYGLQVSDPCEVQPGYYTYVQGAAITTKAQVEAWRRVTDAVHQAGGVLFCQLHHGGRAMVPCNITCADKRVVGPTTQGILSRYTCPAMFSADGTSQPYAQEVSELSPSALAWIVKLFAASAKNAVLAGFDGVEIHAGGGYLIDQFLQQSSNTRTDDYGGSPDRRCRLLDEVVDAVVAVVGRYRVGVRLSPTELSKGMIALEAETLARVAGAHLRDRKVAYVVLSSGSDGFFHGPVPIRIIQALRQNFSGVVMCDDNISVAEAEQRVKEDIVQGVCMTLGAIANPDMMERAIHGVAMEVTDLLTLSTHGAEGYDTYTSYAELRRQLREEQSREWSENEANCPIGRESWLSERRVSAMRQDLKSTRTSQVFTSTPLFQPLTPVTSCTTTSAKAAGAAGGGGASSTSLCSHRRDRRYSSISSLGFRNSSIHFNGSDDVASVNTPNAASGRAALPLKPSRAGSSLYGQRSASGLNESASICVRRDSRANRRQTIG